MSHHDLVDLAKTFSALSLMAIGGANAVVPEIHRQIVDSRRWIDETTFADIFALSQVAPGPNILIVSLIGWHVAGLSGLIVATLAMLVPSSIVALLSGRCIRRLAGVGWIERAQEALAPIAIGLILASGLLMSGTAMNRDDSSSAVPLAIAAAAALFVIRTDRNPLWAIVFGSAATWLQFMLAS